MGDHDDLYERLSKASKDYEQFDKLYKEQADRFKTYQQQIIQAKKAANKSGRPTGTVNLAQAEQIEPPTNDLVRKVLASQMLILKELEEIRKEISELKSQN